MLDFRSLQGRLTLAYVGALLLTLLAFSFTALQLVSLSQRNALDARLTHVAEGLRSFAVWRDGVFQRSGVNPVRVAQLDGTFAESTIFSPSGALLFSTTPAIPDAIRRVAANPHAAAWAGAVGGAAGGLRAGIVPIVRDGVTLGNAIVWHDSLPERAFAARISSLFAFALAIAALVSIVVGALAARAGLRPLYAMTDAVAEIEAHDLSRRVGTMRMPREIERLAQAFNRMLDRLQAAFERERQFTADASHELRAPLTVIRATAEYALETDREGSQYRRALHSIALEANDLEVLVRGLLSTARAESNGPALGASSEIAAVAFDVVEELYPIARARGITVVHPFADELRVALDPDGMARIVRAVLDNAIQHAARGGTVSVAVERGTHDATLVITDDGPGFSGEALLHATERFWRDDPSRQRRDGTGTGLGLAIAQSIASAAGGTLALRNAPQGGAIVRVTLPLAAPVAATVD